MKQLKYTTFLAIIAMVLTSCFDDPGTSVVFDDADAFVELDAASTVSGTRTYTYLRENIGAELPAGFLVRRASGNASSPVNVSFQVEASSTAIEGLHYNVSGTSATIAAGEWSAELPFTILPDAIEAGEVLSIEVTITTADIRVHSDYGSGSHLIQISCPPNIPQDVTWAGVTTEGAFGAFGAATGVTIVQTAAGAITYDVSALDAGFFFNFDPGAAYTGRIVNVCDAITIESSAGNLFGDIATSAANGAPVGSFDAGTNTLTIPWYNAVNDFADISVFTIE